MRSDSGCEKVINMLLNKVIDGYLTKDITNMLEFQSTDKVGHLGSPLAFAILSGMDFLGYLLEGKGKVSDAGRNINYYVVTYFESLVDDEGARKKLGFFLAKEYRNCVNHHFIPKPGLEISKDASNAFLIRRRGEYYTLNVYLLGTLFLESLVDVKKDLLKPDLKKRAYGKYLDWEGYNKFSFSKEQESLLELEFPKYLDKNLARLKSGMNTFKLTSTTTPSGIGLPQKANRPD